MVIPCLYEDGSKTETKISHRMGDLNLQENLYKCAGNVESKGTTKETINPKLQTNERDVMMLLYWRKPSPMKVGMCTWLLQVHM